MGLFALETHYGSYEEHRASSTDNSRSRLPKQKRPYIPSKSTNSFSFFLPGIYYYSKNAFSQPGRYFSGQKRCQICDIFIIWNELGVCGFSGVLSYFSVVSILMSLSRSSLSSSSHHHFRFDMFSYHDTGREVG